jgi:hypothetical protein
VVVGREGVERDRRADVEADVEEGWWWGCGVLIAVAVAEEAVVEDWDCGDGTERSSRVVVIETWGWPYWTSWAVKERGRVLVARSKPEIADSRPD